MPEQWEAELKPDMTDHEIADAVVEAWAEWAHSQNKLTIQGGWELAWSIRKALKIARNQGNHKP